MEPTLSRRGEFYFNDATIGFQGWQSCASCHSSEGRVDGLNWDNLNDGIGNPKNAKSLFLAHRTPPSMALGVRADANIAVRNIRRDANESLKKLVKDKAISEDEERRASDEIQKLTDKFVAEIDKLLAEKEKDIMTV